MSATPSMHDPLTQRARDWHHAHQAAVCDSIEPWAHGTVVRASFYPTYYSFNLVRVEQEPELSAGQLASVADEALAGLEHRRIDFEDIAAADARRAELNALGWRTTRLVWMHHDHSLPPGADELEVSEAPYEAADELRLAWHLEEDDGSEYELFKVAAREVSEARGVRVLTVTEEGRTIAFAQLERSGGGAEITQVYVHPDHRGEGRGTAMTRAAVRAGAGAEDLWIVADDEDRPKELYRRLGFTPVWYSMECLLLR
jgi:ribosomal protein S18 acetylase RimI-like enzyme